MNNSVAVSATLQSIPTSSAREGSLSFPAKAIFFNTGHSTLDSELFAIAFCGTIFSVPITVGVTRLSLPQWTSKKLGEI